MEQGEIDIAKVGVRDGDNVIIRQSWCNQLGAILIALVTLALTSYLTILFPDYTTLTSEGGVVASSAQFYSTDDCIAERL